MSIWAGPHLCAGTPIPELHPHVLGASQVLLLGYQWGKGVCCGCLPSYQGTSHSQYQSHQHLPQLVQQTMPPSSGLSRQSQKHTAPADKRLGPMTLCKSSTAWATLTGGQSGLLNSCFKNWSWSLPKTRGAICFPSPRATPG